jgi:hypothetical protein
MLKRSMPMGTFAELNESFRPNLHWLKQVYHPTQTPNEFAQIPGVMLFEKTLKNQLFSETQQKSSESKTRNQLIKFDF